MLSRVERSNEKSITWFYLSLKIVESGRVFVPFLLYSSMGRKKVIFNDGNGFWEAYVKWLRRRHGTQWSAS